MSFEDFKLQMKNSMLTRRVIQQEVGSRISVPKEEIAKYYEEHKTEFVREEQVFLREIFLSTQGKSPEQAAAIEKKANDLVARARKGEKFPDLARDNSDSDSAKNDGELGWWKRGQLAPEIEQLVFTQKKNYVTDPIKRDGGFLIVKLEERHEKGQATLEDAEPEIMERLYGQRMPPRVREFLTRLREEAFLEIREGYADSGAAPGKDTAWKDPAELKPETVTKAEVASRRKRKLLWVIPMGTVKVEDSAPDQTSQPAGTQAPQPASPAK
jgi:parvulin-like peptidyl-prolyl isomerase